MAGSGEEAILYLTKKFSTMGIESLIVGASARDIVAQKFSFPSSERKTSDVDFAILVRDWSQLKEVEKVLSEDVNIAPSADKGNHVRYTFKSLPFDIVPFGGIERNNQVSWPPFYDSIMTVLGYQEALATAFEFQFDQDKVKVVCPEVLVALKLIAWDENRSRTKDLDDIWYLLRNYNRIDPECYEFALDNLISQFEEVDFEEQCSGPLVLGFKLSKMLQPDTFGKLKEIFSKPSIAEQIVAAVLSGMSAMDEELREKRGTEISIHIKALVIGLG